MTKYQIKFNRDKCVGCGNCQEVCPENWMLKDGISNPFKWELGDVSCNYQAAEECPESCIEILEI